MKKIIFILPLILLLIACQASESDSTQSDMWSIQLISSERTDSLTGKLSTVQYSGDILEILNEFTPADGYTFLLLELAVEKTGAGKAAFSWSDAHILDKDGNKYYRHSNDTFLTNLEMPRLKGTDITFGKEEGFACFEIPKNTADLWFVADGGNIKIKVTS